MRTRRTYAADWALFTDWCAATDASALPADPRTVVEFLQGCPAAPATLRCRVAAIDHHHSAHRHERPGESVAVRAALGRPTGEPFQPTDGNRNAVETALRGLPSHFSLEMSKTEINHAAAVRRGRDPVVADAVRG